MRRPNKVTTISMIRPHIPTFTALPRWQLRLQLMAGIMRTLRVATVFVNDTVPQSLLCGNLELLRQLASLQVRGCGRGRTGWARPGGVSKEALEGVTTGVLGGCGSGERMVAGKAVWEQWGVRT
jgi:hypothetical protein